MTRPFHHLVPALALASALPCQWQQAFPTTTPGAVSAVAMANDLNGGIVMFGGSTGTFPNPFGTTTWLYLGGNWTQLATTGPSGRADAQLVFDAARSVWVLYGGWTSAFTVGSGSNETWEWNGVSWTQVSPVASPGGLWKHAMCYDSLRNRTVLFGGSTNGLPGATSNTWEYNGTTWQQIATTGNPGWRENHAMCFHVGIGRTVLFGGFNGLLNSATNQTWLYDGATWTQPLAVSTPPPARSGHAMVYDLLRGVCIVSGGVNTAGTALDDTWEFDGAAWTQQPTTGPGNREFGFAYDSVSGLGVRYGGIAHTTETWTYGAASRSFGTGCAGSSGMPSLAAITPPRLGQNYTQTLGNLVPALGIAVGVLGLTEITPVPLDGIGMTGCTAYISPDLLQTLVAGAGSSTWTLSIPMTLSLMGTSLFAQGLSVDPGFNPAWLVSSNATEGVIGH